MTTWATSSPGTLAAGCACGSPEGLDTLPDGVGTAIIAMEDLGDRLVTVTRDLGRSILSWDRSLNRTDAATLLTTSNPTLPAKTYR